MRADDVRRWIAGHEAAAERDRMDARAEGPRPERAIRQALGLIAFAAQLHGWPLPDDVVSRREDERAYETWARLRARLRTR